jgi:hypothetical protein
MLLLLLWRERIALGLLLLRVVVTPISHHLVQRGPDK